MTTRNHIDTWRTHLGRALEDAAVAVLDVIDLGIARHPTPLVCDCTPDDRCDEFPKCRLAPPGLRHALDRPDGNFDPTTKSLSRRGDVSNPTAAATLAWESDVQQATTRILEAVDTAWETAVVLGLVPTDEHGRPIAPPAPPMRTTTTLRRIVNTAPSATRSNLDQSCRTVTLQAASYIAAVADQIADRWQHAVDTSRPGHEDPMADNLEHRANQLLAVVTRTAPPLPTTNDARGCDCTSPVCDHPAGGCGNTYRSRHLRCRGCRGRDPDAMAG